MLAVHPAVSFLRRNTNTRSLRGYVEWIGKSVGWWTIVYLIFWLVAFGISGVQMLGRLEEPLPVPLPPLISAVFTFMFALVVYGNKAPPLFLDRRDVYRLALGPVRPRDALRWPFIKAWLVRAAIGLLIGSVYAAVAPYWLHHDAWLAGPVLALILITHVNVRWIRYWLRDNPGADLRFIFALLGVTALSLLGVFVPQLGLAAGFGSSGLWVLVLPAVVAAVSGVLVHRSLEHSWPPRFAPQCFVLAELQAMRAMNIMASLAGQPGTDDPAYRQRLLDTLHDRPGVTRPRRSLRQPPASAPAWRAIDWRTRSLLYRRPWTSQVRLVFTVLLVTAGVLGVISGVGGSFGVLGLALIAAQLGSFTLGPAGYAATLPLMAQQRTLGRLVAVSALLVLATAAAFVSAPFLLTAAVPGELLMTVISLLLLSVLLLEKYSSWTGAPPRRMEAWVVAGLLASAPAMLLAAFTLPGLILPVQLGVLLLLYILPG